MEYKQKPTLNELNALNTTSDSANKNQLYKINGQMSIESNKRDVPVIPSKPIRSALSAKRGPNGSIQHHQDQQQINNKLAPVASAAETDEIEFLLDEIQDLEVPACRTDSEQDFEIAGSRVDLDLSLRLDSPIDTSWYYYSILLKYKLYLSMNIIVKICRKCTHTRFLN